LEFYSKVFVRVIEIRTIWIWNNSHSACRNCDFNGFMEFSDRDFSYS